MRVHLLPIAGSSISACICVLLGASIRTARADEPPVLEYLDEIPTYSYSGPAAVSDDGNTIAGTYWIGSVRRAFVWTSALGMTDIGTLGGTSASAVAISADGRVVAGSSQISPTNSWRAFRWTIEDGMRNLGLPVSSTTSSYASHISTDGSTVVGVSYGYWMDESFVLGFRWRPTSGMGGIGERFSAFGVSADGSVVCGAFESVWNGPYSAALWQSGTIRYLGSFGEESVAMAVSGDGTVVVGASEVGSTTEYHLFRWTASDGMKSLFSLGSGGYSGACITDDGEIIVGSMSSSEPGFPYSWPYFWTEEMGLRNLNTYLGQIGVDLQGGVIVSPSSVSRNGSAIVGVAHRDGAYRAFRITNMSYDRPDCPIDYNGTGDSGDVLDLLDFLDDFGACELQPAPCGTIGNADFNADGIVDILDFLDFLDGFGRGC